LYHLGRVARFGTLHPDGTRWTEVLRLTDLHRPVLHLLRPTYEDRYVAFQDIAALAHVPQIAWRDGGLVLGVGHEPLYLLNATCPGSELESDGYMTIHLQPGRYAIATAEYAPDSDTSLLLHRLTRMSSAPSDTGRTILL